MVQENKKQIRQAMPMPELLLKLLAGTLAGIMFIALTLFFAGMIAPRGFWTLSILLAVLAFVVVPVIRKKFVTPRS
ncbi:hypothetical protein HQ545_04210 [Candidatus Woesearchaeota archaeon]|nr:hypothetical protein [Candidatus Woesearchaeota archaeon]